MINAMSLTLLLPKLKNDSDVRPSDEAGKWQIYASKAFGDVASSLDYKSPGQVKSVSSVPTMWARPLSMEMALHNRDYPIRDYMIEQWQGMLAAIAFAETRRFPLSAQLLELGDLRLQNPFARSLYELLPDPNNTLYRLDNNKHPWQDVFVFLWNNQPVGMTSPSTLVVPSEEGKWTGLPWWNVSERRLEAPHNYINRSEKALLWRWLEKLYQELNNHNGEAEALDMVRGIIGQFRNSLGNYPEQALSLSNNPQFFGISLNRGVLQALNRPVKAEPRETSVRLIPSRDKQGQVPDLIIIDREIARAWDESLQNIWVYQDQTLASLRIEDLKSGKTVWKDIKWIESQDLFLPELKFIDLEDALPGAFLPEGIKSLTFNGQQITPLLPLNPLLLNYFTPEDLLSKVNITTLNSGDGPLVRLMLDLPLSGIKNDQKNPQNYRIFKDYPILETNALEEVPVLEIWPYFQLPGWKEYYGFYCDAEFGEQTFQVSFPETRDPHIFQEGRSAFQITRMDSFPSHIICQDRDRHNIGLILLKSPREVQATGDWVVGVDFGTSFTNVYVNRKGMVDPLTLESLHLKVTEVLGDTRLNVLFEYFISPTFVPPEKPLPLSSVLTTRGNLDQSLTQQRPLYDGRIYIPDNNRFEPQQDWMEIDLKWKNFDLNKLFLKHLALHINALAAHNGIKQIQWSLSFPSAFSRRDKTIYVKNWQDLTRELASKTGINQLCPEVADHNHFRTESLAIAQYFADQEGENLVSSTCIDMGGGTSDISVWEENQLVHQCSVQLAGRHLFSQFLELNPDFLANRFDFYPGNWKGLKDGKFSAKLDVWLRLESETWLKDKRYLIEEESDFQGLLRLVTIGMAGLYYYVGTILGTLYKEQKYTRNEITPVYMGGNGSRLLNWLSTGGKFDRYAEINELFSYMLSKGSGFADTNEITYLSKRPKDEVACGLVLNDTKLTGLDRKQKDPLIAGEDCQVNGESITWEDRLDLEGDIKSFEIGELVQLHLFLDEFNQAIKDLKLEGITPMTQFKPGEGLDEKYRDKLWKDTQRELKATLLKMKGDADNIQVEPPFILGLKALLRVLGKEWSGK